MRRTLLLLACAASLFFAGCRNNPTASEETIAPESGAPFYQRQLDAYHRELERLTAAGEITPADAEKFYAIARLETARRIAQYEKAHRGTTPVTDERSN